MKEKLFFRDWDGEKKECGGESCLSALKIEKAAVGNLCSTCGVPLKDNKCAACGSSESEWKEKLDVPVFTIQVPKEKEFTVNLTGE